MHTQVPHPSGFTTITAKRILNTLDDEGTAPPEVSVEYDGLANRRPSRVISLRMARANAA